MSTTFESDWENTRLKERIEELEREIERKMSAAAFVLKERDTLQADNARLRDGIRDFLVEWDNCRSSGEWPVRRFAAIHEALAATSEQSLARHDNRIKEECVKLCWYDMTPKQIADAIRATKGQE